MLPEFPKMKSIELSDREDVEKITKKYPPYLICFIFML
jgi:hypothetical protein